MRVLFISSSLPSKEPSPIIANQAKSLKEAGADINLFLIRSKGLKGYLKEVFILHKYLQQNKFDIYHAHYGLSAIVATLAGAKPLVVSLMGSDVKEEGWQQWLIKRFSKRRWVTTIAKSQELADIVGSDYCKVIPNGVDMALFKPMPQQECREKLNLEQNKTYVLFAANPARPEKNFTLAKSAFDALNLEPYELLYLQNVPHGEIPTWMNAANVVILTSLWEGSPNVIKEALACNRPIVSTNVGDVAWLCESVEGCFISDMNESDFRDNLLSAIAFSELHLKTRGRQRIKQLKLDATQQAQKIIGVYNSVLK